MSDTALGWLVILVFASFVLTAIIASWRIRTRRNQRWEQGESGGGRWNWSGCGGGGCGGG